MSKHGSHANIQDMKLAQGKNDGHGDHYSVVTQGPHGKGVHTVHTNMMAGASPNIIASGKGHAGKKTNTLNGID